MNGRTPAHRATNPHKLRTAYAKLVTENLQAPEHAGKAYLKVYPGADPKWASQRA